MYGLKPFVLAFFGPLAAVLTGRLAVHSAVGCFGWLDRCALLVHEM